MNIPKKTLTLLFLSSFLLAKEYIQKNDNFTVLIDSASFKYRVINTKGSNQLGDSTSAGLLLNDSPVNSVQKLSEGVYRVTSDSNLKAKVEVKQFPNTLKLRVTPEGTKQLAITFNTSGGSPAYGLGDHGGWLKNADISQHNKPLKLTNDGGAYRFISSFMVLPKDRLAGVIFSRKPMEVSISKEAYQMKSSTTSSISCYYFFGDLKEIYAAYQKVCANEGFVSPFPKFDFFELGWESWDLLGWRTKEQTVRKSIAQFIKAGYPIKWIVTGSGYWRDGGCSTNFGEWNQDKYNPTAFRKWLKGHNIKWLIGLRTNFPALSKTAHKPKGRQDRNAKMIPIEQGPYTKEGITKDFFFNNNAKYKSRFYPLVPSHILDSNKPGAAEWYANLYQKWQVDGIKEDTMIGLSDSTLFNKAMFTVSETNALVMARCAAYQSPGTLLRINDTHGNRSLRLRTPINYLQYAASGAPNVYSDSIGFHSMDKYSELNMKNAWLQALTAGAAVSKGPFKWSEKHQALFKKAIDFKYSITPYIYSAAVTSHETGYPYTMTPLPIAFPDDANTYHLASATRKQFQWLLGESIMAYLPLTKRVYIPKGTWMHYESEKIYQGPQTLENHETPVSEAPCFIGGKGIVVFRDNSKKHLQATVYPVTPLSSQFTFNFKNKEKSTIVNALNEWAPEKLKVLNTKTSAPVPFTVNPKNNSITFDILPNTGYKITH